jgi:hypothetical protein
MTAIFSDKVGKRWDHVVDRLIGKEPFTFISFSKKHFTEVVLPAYVCEKWPKDMLAYYK